MSCSASPLQPFGVRAGSSLRARITAAVAVVIPALNEESSIGAVLDEIPADLVSCVIVADNSSTDRTRLVAEGRGARIVREPRRGYGAACLAGIRHLPGDAEIVVFLDADHSDFPEEMFDLVAPIIEERADLVIGSRMATATARRTLGVAQRFGNWLATRLMDLLWGFRYTDLGPFRAIRRTALDHLGMSDRDYGWTIEMQIKAGLAGLRVLEVPVRYRQRIGQSKISGSLRGVVLAGTKILCASVADRKSHNQIVPRMPLLNMASNFSRTRLVSKAIAASLLKPMLGCVTHPRSHPRNPPPGGDWERNG